MDTPQPVTRTSRLDWGTIRRFARDHWRDYLTLFLIAGAIIGLDQWTKALVRTYVPVGQDWMPSWLEWLHPYARVRYWYNSGAAFGFFQSGNLIFSILAVVVACVILYYVPRVSPKDWWLRLAMGMQFSGALGNLIDRIIFKRVTDFISVGRCAVFNVADASITVGVILLIAGAWITERAAKKKAATQPATDAASEAAGGTQAAGEDQGKGG